MPMRCKPLAETDRLVVSRTPGGCCGRIRGFDARRVLEGELAESALSCSIGFMASPSSRLRIEGKGGKNQTTSHGRPRARKRVFAVRARERCWPDRILKKKKRVKQESVLARPSGHCPWAFAGDGRKSDFGACWTESIARRSVIAFSQARRIGRD